MNNDVMEPKSKSTPRPAMRGFWLVALILLGLGLAIFPFDFALSDARNIDQLPGDLSRIFGLSEIFAHGFGVAMAAIGIWLLASNERRFIPRVVACALWPAAGVLLLKTMIGRLRPIEYFDGASGVGFRGNVAETWLGWFPNHELNIHYATRAFPSAHAATAWGLAIGMAWVFPKGRWLFFGAALLASVQRVTSQAHWSSDVFFGAAIAFVMSGALTQNWALGYWFGRFENRHELKLLSVDDGFADRRAA